MKPRLLYAFILLFLHHTSSSQHLVFADQFGGNDSQTALSIAADHDENVFVAVVFYDELDADPGPGEVELEAEGSADFALIKLNSVGEFIWAIQFGSDAFDGARKLVTDDDGNVIICGYFKGTIDFDPGNGTSNLTSADYYDAFIECLNADGTFAWVTSYGGNGWQDASSIAIDGSRRIHLAGQFEQTADFDPSNNTFELTSNGYTDCYHLELDSAGNFISVFQVGGVLDDWVQKMVLDDEEGILTCGHFSWVTDFDPGPEEYDLTSYTGWDGFAAKYCTAYTIENFVSLCEGDSIFAGGAWQTGPGDYYDYFDPSIGCDSTVITHLSFSHPVVDLGNDLAFCEGEPVSLDAGNAGAEFLWSSGEVSQSIMVTDGGTYSVKVTDANGCTATDTVVVTVNALPVMDLGSDITLCEGDSSQLDAGNPGSNYLWNTGATSQTIYVSASSLYAVVVTDNNNCTNADTIEVTVHPLPVVYLNAGDTIVCLSSASMPLPEGFPSGGYYAGDGVSENNFNPGIAGLGDHTITYSYTDSFGCSSSDSLVITVVICTHTESMAQESFRAYPNPSDGLFVLERKAPAYEVISVTDVEGTQLKQFTLHDEEKTIIDLHDLPAGIYFLVNDRKGMIRRIVLCDN
jgi:hypothetical protein